MPATPTPSRIAAPVGDRVLAFWAEKFGNAPHGADVVSVVHVDGEYDTLNVSVVQNPYDPADSFQLDAWPQDLNIYPRLSNDERNALTGSGVLAWAEFRA